ncbi:MAG: Gfo/Idh/MocA family oxidoreductase [Spirochaetia bacterium]|nr:Gfo/Idh/MocA family oxidoreductase [Spirochaetia bacterium]
MKLINWGIIGCGNVTEVKSGPGLYKSENSNLKGVFNRNIDKAISYVNRHGLEKVYKSVQEMLADDELDVIYIATPPNSHKEYAIATLKAGKIPYIEKPVALSLEESMEIKTLSETLQIPVYIAFYRRGLDKFIKIKELLDKGEIGSVRYVYVTQIMKVEESELNRTTLPWRVIPSISGGGKFLDMAVHVLDCLIWYFGEMESIEGIVENRGGYYEAEDTIVANYRFKNGIVGSGTWCYVADKEINEVHIVGEKGRIVYDGLSATSFYVEKNGETQQFEFEQPTHVAMPYQQAVVNELIGKVKSYANFQEAINLVEMTDSLLKQYYK